MKILALRKSKGMTQAALAAAAGTTQQQIAKIENGIVDPQLSTLRKIADALGVELRDPFYTKKEFLRAVEETVRERKLDLKKVSLLELNRDCAEARKIPSFHPFWELIELNRGALRLKENPHG